MLFVYCTIATVCTQSTMLLFSLFSRYNTIFLCTRKYNTPVLNVLQIKYNCTVVLQVHYYCTICYNVYYRYNSPVLYVLEVKYYYSVCTLGTIQLQYMYSIYNTTVLYVLQVQCYFRYNSTVLAYGQTGSGKSFTMQEDPDHIGQLVRNYERKSPEKKFLEKT